MEAAEAILFKLFGVFVLIGGVYVLVTGRLKIGVEGTDSYDRVVSGPPARWLGIGLIAAGACFFVDVLVAVVATIVLALLAFVLGDPRKSN